MERIETPCRYRPIRLKGVSHGLCEACAVRGLAVCGALAPHCIEKLQRLITRIHLGPKQMLFIEEEAAAHCFTIVEGAISIARTMVDGRRQIVGFLFPGDFVGAFSDDVYSCAAQAIGKVELCRFPRQSFVTLAEEFPELEHRLLHAVSTELVEAQKHMLILGRQSAEERLASFLLHLSERASRCGEPDSPVHLPMPRGDIGDYLGLSLETVSRTFTVLSDKGQVALTDAHTIELRNRDELLRLAGGAR